ncbi:hypothetical protein SAMN05216548_108203 [Faunimonas pinastri]|uniref:Uncharacterized protein n=1 Tax=Faunimonas pinastri TaxID=1855383 RepID=A0A1H9JP76_9HYPH|nr:hypothetical protein [Faunimonas pinastri]SEQ88617.1 hypothetical protein SAMN05216548_108203 [Faunimonas pinastri]
MDKKILAEIVNVLNFDAWNYTVFLDFREVSLPEPTETAVIIKTAFGAEATLGGIKDVEKTSVWPFVKDALLYTGDYAHGPAAATMQSGKLLALLEDLEGEVCDLVAVASSIKSFWMNAGHPAYPVFWDFAVLFSSKSRASILIGSSSD